MSADEIGCLNKFKKKIENSASDCFSFRKLITQCKIADQKKISERQNKKYNLGNGEEFNDPLEAAEKLLQREYGDTFLFDDEKQEAVFIPPVFTSDEYKKKLAGGANLDDKEINEELQQTVGKCNNNEEYRWLIGHINRYLDSEITLEQMQKNIKKDSKYMQMEKEDELVERILKYSYGRVGNLIEHKLYRILENCTFLNKTVIIHNLTIYQQPKGENFENDFILFIPTRKLVVVIESKRTFPDKDNKAKKQLELSYNMFVEKLQHLEGWQFVPMIFTTNDKTTIKQKNGHPQVMTPKCCTKKLENIVEGTDEETENQNETKENLRKALEILIFVFHASTKPVTKSNWVEYIDKSIEAVCTKGNIVFYSKEQLQILNEKKLLLIGGYGTGKSFLMQQKVEELMKDHKDKRPILYAISGENNHSIMFYYQMKKKLENNDKKVEVKHYPDKKMKDILEYAKSQENNFKAVFIDELILSEKGDTCTESDKDWMDKLEYFWVAPRDKEQVIFLNDHQEAGLESFGLTKFQLSKNIRNSKAVWEFTKQEIDLLKCSRNVSILLSELLINFPAGNHVSKLYSPIKCIQKALISASKGILVVVGIIDNFNLFFFLSKLSNIYSNKIGYLKYSYCYRENCKGWDQLKFYSYKSEECIDFLEKKGNILLVSVECIAGFEWPSVVCIGQILSMERPDTEHFVNAYLRSTVDLYLDKYSLQFP